MPPRFKELYKPHPSERDARSRRLTRESQLRRLHREQLFMGKRLRLRTPQESETESEYEFTPTDTQRMVAELKSPQAERRVSALRGLSAKLEQPSEELRRFVVSGDCIGLLTGILGRAEEGEETLQSLRCLTNIAAFDGVSGEEVRVAVPYLVGLLGSGNAEVRNQAAWALGNVAAEGEQAREHLFAGGALPLLVEMLGVQDAELMQTACFALSNMARRPSSFFDLLFAQHVPQTLARQLERFKDDQACVAELAWVCAYLAAASSAEQLDLLLACGAIDLILRYTTENTDCGPQALLPIIRTLGNIAAGTDSQTHALVARPGFVPLLVRCIESPVSRAVEKESLWALSSVTAGTKDDVDAVVAAGIIPDLVRIVESQTFDLKKEAAYSVLNIAIVGKCLGDMPVDRLVPEFVDFVRSQDDELVRMGVQFVVLLFDQMPENGGVEVLRRTAPEGIEALENLMAVTDDDDTRATVSALIDRYYGDDEEEEEA
ncbi:hypothetical protein GGI15_001318 [Coemansia interrupta]|uniref:Importin subunit alpha n=1 Tax=Coemansia interrupta TaxID=1126814 RepID=A0A9W8HQF9_9FUNG|nr:hypothetical protein GGI15_001318 [Coemansia interrupta]